MKPFLSQRRALLLLLLIGCGLILSFQWRITLPDLSQVGHLRRRKELVVRQTVHGVCDDALPPIQPPHRVGGLERYRRLLRSQLLQKPRPDNYHGTARDTRVPRPSAAG